MHRVQIKHFLRGLWSLYDQDQNQSQDQEDPIPSGLFHGYLWNRETGAIQATKQRPIVGIVDLTNRTRYGFSSKGVPQYLFHPLDPRYPPMIVGCKAPTTVSQMAIVNANDVSWINTKWPRVSLQELLGPVGDPEVEQMALRKQVCRGGKQKTDVDPDMLAMEALAMEADTAALATWEEPWDICFNIDPPGCRDIDDVLAFRRLVDGRTEVAIGIANVAAAVPVGSGLDTVARERGETVYDSEGHVIEPMLPTSISEDSASLLSDGKPRSVVAACWVLGVSEGVEGVEGPEWRVFSVVNNRSFTYDSILEEPALCSQLQRALTAICGSCCDPDPHKWVELAMIAYNRAAAQRLVERGAGLLRRHAGIRHEEMVQLANQTRCRELGFLGFAAGEYVPVGASASAAAIGAAASAEDRSHAGLGLSLYCHASSPLRRYADLVNQRILVGMFVDDIIDHRTLARDLNERAREIKAFERSSWCLAHLSAKKPISAQGWLIGWSVSQTEVRLRIYVPAWKRTVRIPMVFVSESSTSVLVQARADATGAGATATATAADATIELQKGTAISVSAFWNLRATPDHRFVFGMNSVGMERDAPYPEN